MKLVLFGGLYSNYLALEAAISDATARGVDAMYCLGDLGRDNYFAQISYDYTLKNTSDENKVWLRNLPKEIRLHVDGLKVLLCHGSPRKTNEFLWESTTSTGFLKRLCMEHDADVIVGTHSGIHWQRALPDGKRYVNVGVLGRPENDGQTSVWSTILRTGADADPNAAMCHTGNAVVPISVDFIPIEYDHLRLANEMRQQSLPDEFIDTVLNGWWTTCLEILPSRERRAGRY